jgi:UDP-N-acetylglucosamine 2-epimerase (non-hydrolysing)
MKVMTVLGTRPEIIRLSRILGKLDRLCTHRLVHTGQNYDPSLNDVFFCDLGLRAPDYHLQCQGPFGAQVGRLLADIEDILRRERPDRFLILGDTNSSLSAIVAKRMGIPVYHMEAGNRCFDERVPEEVNRRIIDHASDILLPYTERSRDNLLREGIPPEQILVTGNPIREVLQHYAAEIAASTILSTLGLARGEYFLVTLHRAENVDVETRLRALVEGLVHIHGEYEMPVIVSTHPRTRQRLADFDIGSLSADIRFLPPFGFFDFIALEQCARAVLTDSGTVQEEAAIFGIPNVTLRDTTERPETIECGSNVLSGADPESMQTCLRLALETGVRGAAPAEYLVENVSDIVLKVVLGHRPGRPPERERAQARLAVPWQTCTSGSLS